MRRLSVYFLVLVAFGTSLLDSGCAANEAILKSNTSAESESQQSNVEPAKSSIDKDLEAMRTADFNYIFVLRRRDGAKMDADDRAVVRSATADANRRSLSDDDKAVIVGTNYPVPADKMKTLADRFSIEDHSKPDAELQRQFTNSNRNANAAPAR